ncbi:MAG: recombinase family protein [Phaeobacter italicus]
MLIGYARVSTDGGDQTTDLQRDALFAAGVDQRHLFEDRASGARDDRPALRAALDYVQAGDVLLVWKLDRLGRSLSHLLQIVRDLEERGIGFRSLTQSNLDTTTAEGRLFFSIFGALAEYERALIQERVRAGIDAAARRGRRGGRPRAIDDEKLAAIIASLEGGSSKSAVCRSFGVKRTTLIDALARVGWSGPDRSSPP